MERAKLFTFFFVLLAVAIIATVVYILSPFLKPILWAVVFTVITYPAYKFVRVRLKSKTLSALFVVSVVVFAFIVPIFAVGVVSLRELLQLSKSVVVHYKSLSLPELSAKLSGSTLFKVLSKWLPVKELSSKDVASFVISTVRELANFSAVQLKSVLVTTGGALLKLFIFVFTYFFLLKDSEEFGLYLKRFIPLEEKDKEDILSSIYIATLSVVYGTLGTALVQGTIGLLVYCAFSVPYPFVWGFLTAYASFIPPFGASFVWFPLSVYMALKVSLIKGILMGTVSLALISSMDNIVKPLIMKNRVRTPYIVLFFAIFGGLIKFGFIGMFLGPILFNLMFSLVRIYEEKFLKSS